jgi:hypothetical protein
MTLPEDMLATANRESNEEAWRPADFQVVLELASVHRLACVGGQFQFRGPIATAEMYWLNADSMPRRPAEDWDSYVGRANSEVLRLFTRLLEQTDFGAEALQWNHIVQAIQQGTIADPTDNLYFVAYFSRDPEIAEPRRSSERLPASTPSGGAAVLGGWLLSLTFTLADTSRS